MISIVSDRDLPNDRRKTLRKVVSTRLWSDGLYGDAIDERQLLASTLRWLNGWNWAHSHQANTMNERPGSNFSNPKAAVPLSTIVDGGLIERSLSSARRIRSMSAV